jgi:thiol-disulfide isomerase/thioredoxin
MPDPTGHVLNLSMLSFSFHVHFMQEIIVHLKLMLPILVFFSFVSAAQSDDTSPRTPYGILHDEWKAERDLLKQASDPNDPQKLKDKQSGLRRVYTHRFLKLAMEHPADDLWLDCLIWIGVEGEPGPDLDGMVDFMQSHAKEVGNTVQLQLFMSELIPLESDRLNPALASIAETHLNTSVRGAALYALSARTKILAERDGSPEGCKAAEKLLRQVIVDFPDISTYRGQNKENAERLLQDLQSPVAIGKSAPETKGKTLKGSPFDLADHRGKVVVLSFSGHWCGPCVAMHAIEKQLLNKYTREELAIIEINSDGRDNLESVIQKMEKDGLHWEVVADGPDGPLSKSWHVTSWPTFYVLDRSHQIRRKVVGYIGRKLIDCADQLINEGRE